MPQLILFDLDGTLVDSVPDLYASIAQMLDTLHLPAVSETQVRAWVGNGADRLVHRALTLKMDECAEASLFAEARALFGASYARLNGQGSRLYPDVREALQALRERNIPLALVTNKPEAFTLPLLQALNIEHYFVQVVSGDSLPTKKPDPAPLLHVAKTQGVDVEHCLMVGDSIHDLNAARAAGMRVACVPYGYNHGEDIALSQPDILVESLLQLL